MLVIARCLCEVPFQSFFRALGYSELLNLLMLFPEAILSVVKCVLTKMTMNFSSSTIKFSASIMSGVNLIPLASLCLMLPCSLVAFDNKRSFVVLQTPLSLIQRFRAGELSSYILHAT